MVLHNKCGVRTTQNSGLRKQTNPDMYEEKPWQKYHIGKYTIESQNHIKYEMIYERMPSRIHNEFGNLMDICAWVKKPHTGDSQ